MDVARDVDPGLLFKKQCSLQGDGEMDQGYLQEGVSVQVTGTPDELKIENSIHPETDPKKKTGNENISIKIVISTSSSMELSRDGLDYRSLRTFIERLEDLLC